jgi:hypothetical protein
MFDEVIVVTLARMPLRCLEGKMSQCECRHDGPWWENPDWAAPAPSPQRG